MKWLRVLASFFPSWRFFDNLGVLFCLEVRFGKTENEFSSWQEILPPISRSFRNVILNPYGNFLHGCQNLLTRFNAEVSALKRPGEIVNSATYQAVRNLSQYEIDDKKLIARPYCFQFRLKALYPKHAHQAPVVVLTSLTYTS